MKRILLVLFLSVFVYFDLLAVVDIAVKDSTGKGINTASSQIKLKQARNKFLAEDFKSALAIYRELIGSHPEDAMLKLRAGECYIALKNYEQAVESLEEALKINPEVNKNLKFLLGQAYHRTGEFDKAIEMFEGFKLLAKEKQEEFQDAVSYIGQCNTAKALIAAPVNVDIINSGNRINSKFDDYGPSVSADAKVMIFTSRRPDTRGGAVDPGDGKFYEDIYISFWDEQLNAWGEAEAVQGRLNTEFHDAALSISPDGKQIFVYRNVPGETGSGDIYVSKVNAQGKWSAPTPMPKPINTSYFESSACMSADGNYIYFISEKRGGYGLGDIYRAKRSGRSEWGEPENLGDVINTPEDEVGVFIHPDGKTLFFSSKGHNTMGGYDIFKSVYEKGKWSKPVNIGYPINTLNDDLHFVMTSDNKRAYYSSLRPEGLGERDIYEINLERYNIMGGKEDIVKKHDGLSIIKGNIVDSDEGHAIEANIIFIDVSNGSEAGNTVSSTEGEYFITLPGDKEYEVIISLKGYKEIREKFILPIDDKTVFIKEKHFIAEKQ
jgi:tetratricopeptide (TPR) repeat protein